MSSTQLASWAELRHDTILYAKQSYTGAASCEYPDAYVDPYPEFFARIGAFAAQGTTLVSNLDLGGAPLGSGDEEMVRRATEGRRHSRGDGEEPAHWGASFGRAHRVHQPDDVLNGCGSMAEFNGWYAQLFFDPSSAMELDPVVADVHTQPTDEGGTMVGKVLHVGTGMPRTMVVTVESCAGPRAYVGLASSYFEKVTTNFTRLTDEKWSTEITAGTPPDVTWMKDLVQR